MLSTIEDRPFCIFANSEVFYDGRASSVLERGNYLIIYKNDKSVSIHGGTMITPRNYMGESAKLSIEPDCLLFTRKREIVKVKLHEIHYINYLDNWSEAKITICKTEKELVQKLLNNWKSYFEGDFQSIELEYNTEFGPIDILGFINEIDVIVEVKRKRAAIKDVTQLLRYKEALEFRKRECKAYLAAPDISKTALKYLNKHGLNYIQIGFD